MSQSSVMRKVRTKMLLFEENMHWQFHLYTGNTYTM